MNESTQVLTIGENFRLLRGDDLNLQLDELRIVKSSPNRFQKEYKETEKCVRVGWYGDFKTAMKAVLDQKLSTSLTGEVNDLLDVIAEARKDIDAAVDKAGLFLESFPKPLDGRGRKTVEVAQVSSQKGIKTVTTPATKKTVNV